MIFSRWSSLFGPQNCHCNQIVTVTGVTEGGETCILRFVDKMRMGLDIRELDIEFTTISNVVSYQFYLLTSLPS